MLKDGSSTPRLALECLQEARDGAAKHHPTSRPPAACPADLLARPQLLIADQTRRLRERQCVPPAQIALQQPGHVLRRAALQLDTTQRASRSSRVMHDARVPRGK